MNIVQLARRFDDRAAHYDSPLTAFIAERELRQIRALVPEMSDVFDYGCGTGRTTLDLLRRGCSVTAYDISTNMLARAQAKLQRAGFQAEYIIDLDQISGRTWPLVTCIGVLDYYPDALPVLWMLGGYLKPGGQLVITFPNALSPCGWLYMLASQFTVPITPRSPAFAKRAAHQAGFRIESMRYAFPAVRLVGYTIVLALSK